MKPELRRRVMVLWVSLVLLVLAVGGAGSLVIRNRTNPDPSSEDYRRRMMSSWPGAPPEYTALYARALAQHGVDHQRYVFPSGPHGRGLSRHQKYAKEWPALCLDWLRRRGFVDGGDE